jgi:hypothetical protein
MGFFKGKKDTKETVHAAPRVIEQAQVMQAYAQQQATAASPAGGATAEGDIFAPIAGVTVQQYVAVARGIAAYNYDQNMLPSVAASMGIDADSWAQAAAGFNARVTSSPAFAQHFNTLYRQS